MIRSIQISRVLLISLVGVIGCQNRAPSLRMLETRSDYGSELHSDELSLYQRGGNAESVARRSAPRIAVAYIFPHELPTHDFFLGGDVALIVSQDDWIVGQASLTSEVQQPPAAIREVGKTVAKRSRTTRPKKPSPGLTQ